MREGVIQFDNEHTQRGDVTTRYPALTASVIAWRDILARLSLVGQDPARYEGLGYGNVSARVPPYSASKGKRAFLVTGSQTGGVTCMTPSALALVKAYDWRRGWVQSEGLVPPSSEAATHAAVYDLGAHVRWVFHVHSPLLWRWACEKPGGSRLPTTSPSAANGTIALAEEVRRLWRGSTLPETRMLAMGGHEDGLLIFGRSADEAGNTLTHYLAIASAARLEREGELCR